MTMAAGFMPGPPSRDNACASISGTGLLAYGAASSVAIIDTRSMQLVLVLPMPPSKSSALAPFVSALEFLPEGLCSPPLLEFAQPQPQLQLAAGDRHGRIIVWDVTTATPAAALVSGSSPGAITQVCWLHSSTWLLAAIHGTTTVVVWDVVTRSALWRYDAAAFGETLASLRRDPHDQHQLCVLGSKGLLLSVIVNGTSERDILTKVYHVKPTSATSGTTTSDERDTTRSSASGGQISDGASARCLFSSSAKGILYVAYPREICVFDLHFGMTLSSSGIPRSCGKLLDVVADLDGRLLVCVHLDGKLSVWKRKDGTQVFTIVYIETLMPSLGTSVPAPALLAATLFPSNLTSAQQRLVLGSISDDGRLWHWLLHCENEPEFEQQ